MRYGATRPVAVAAKVSTVPQQHDPDTLAGETRQPQQRPDTGDRLFFGFGDFDLGHAEETVHRSASDIVERVDEIADSAGLAERVVQIRQPRLMPEHFELSQTAAVVSVDRRDFGRGHAATAQPATPAGPTAPAEATKMRRSVSRTTRSAKWSCSSRSTRRIAATHSSGWSC